MRKIIFAAVAALVASPAGAQQPPPPKLLVVISVDQFSADLFDEYRPHFTGGFARLATGAVFHNGYQSHAATETCPGHSTILTGDHPARTGIIGNSWQNLSAPRDNKTVYCAEDEFASGATATDYDVSPVHLRVPTLGDDLKRASPTSRNVAVSGKDRSAIMMSGHVADQRWYWNGKTFVTDLKNAPVPRSVVRAQAAVASLLAAPSTGLESPPICSAKAQPITLPGRSTPVGNGNFSRAAGDAAAFRASPQLDASVLALAAGLVQELRLGTGGTPDILSVGLSATDYIGHTYGPGGQEMCLQLLEVDRDLGDFLDVLDATGVDYAVALTADHGGPDIPERLRAKGVADAAWIDPALAPKAVSARLAKQLGINGPVLHGEGPVGDIYLDAGLNVADRQRALAAAIAFYRGQPQIYAGYTKEELARTPMPTGSPVSWSVVQRARASFDPQRSGDLYIVAKPHIMPIVDRTGYVSTHGSPWDYDRRVPILFWRPGFRGATIEQPAETTDIMPTLAALLELPIALGSVDGHCLEGTPAFCTRP